MAIDFQEGLGGWTIVIKNKGYKPTELECSAYRGKTKSGYTYFYEDRAMREARALDAAQHGVQPTPDHASAIDSSETENVAGRGG